MEFSQLTFLLLPALSEHQNSVQNPSCSPRKETPWASQEAGPSSEGSGASKGGPILLETMICYAWTRDFLLGWHETQLRPMGCERGLAEKCWKRYSLSLGESSRRPLSSRLEVVVGDVLQFCPHINSQPENEGTTRRKSWRNEAGAPGSSQI